MGRFKVYENKEAVFPFENISKLVCRNLHVQCRVCMSLCSYITIPNEVIKKTD